MHGRTTEIYQIYNRGNSTLEIPVYQRNYDWGIPQCSRLMDDLEILATADKRTHPKHFFGSVVGRSEDAFRWIVIDGQQRLTTISLLILALTHAINAGDLPTNDDDLGANLIDDYLLIGGNRRKTKFKLKPVKNDAAAYQALFGPEDDFINSSNITANYRYFRDRLRKTSLSADQIWNAIERLEVMHLELEAHDDPQRIFESLNSTGLDLSEADKIRNLVLMNQDFDEQQRLYEERWNPIEKNVDHHTDWFIRIYLVAKTGRTPKAADVFETFKTYTERPYTTMSQILDDMYDYSKHSRDITHSATGWPDVDRQLSRMNRILSDAVRPFLMPVLRDAKDGEISQTDLINVLRIIETYLFRRITCTIAANTLANLFATAYTELRKLRTDQQPYADILTYLLRRRDGGSGRFPNDGEFTEHFESRDFYHLPRNSYRQYLFDVLENGHSKDTRDIAAGIASGDLTIEHIMPQTLTDTWRRELGDDHQRIHDIWENRIANLTVTGYNSAYSNSPFHRKKTMDKGFASSPYRLNDDVRNAATWGEEQLRRRSRRLTAEALDNWPFAHTDFTPPAVVLPTVPMGDDDSFRSRQITAYQFDDAKETVASWTDMLPKVLSLILQQHRQPLLDFAATEALLTTDPTMINSADRRIRKIDPGLGVYVNSGTTTKISLLRRIFDHLDLDTDDLVFTLRPNHGDVDTDNSAAEAPGTPDSPYTALTKFLDRFDEATAGTLDLDDTTELRDEFAAALTPFRRENPLTDLGGQSAEEFIRHTPPDKMTTEQILALITLPVSMATMMGPSVLHTAITSGELSTHLRHLAGQ